MAWQARKFLVASILFIYLIGGAHAARRLATDVAPAEAPSVTKHTAAAPEPAAVAFISHCYNSRQGTYRRSHPQHCTCSCSLAPNPSNKATAAPASNSAAAPAPTSHTADAGAPSADSAAAAGLNTDAAPAAAPIVGDAPAAAPDADIGVAAAPNVGTAAAAAPAPDSAISVVASPGPLSGATQGQRSLNATASRAASVKAMRDALQQLGQRVNARMDDADRGISARVDGINHQISLMSWLQVTVIMVFGVFLLVNHYMLMRLRRQVL